MRYLTLVPAYGRDYKSAKSVRDAWNAGQDFRIADISHPDDGRYVNHNDAPTGTTFNIRYNALRSIAVVKGAK